MKGLLLEDERRCSSVDGKHVLVFVMFEINSCVCMVNIKV